MKKRYFLYILLAGTLWGGISLFLTPLLEVGFTRIQGIVLRCGVAVLFLAGFMLIKDRDLLRIKVKDLWCFVGTGIISLLLFSLCYFYAIEEVGVGVAAILLYTSPAFVMLFSLGLFKEKITGKKILALGCTIWGCVLVSGVTGAQPIDWRGVLAGIGSGLFYGLYSIFSRYALQRGYKSMTISFYTFLFCLLAVLPFSGPWGTAPAVSLDIISYSIGLGVLACAMPYIFYTKGLEKVESSKASIIVAVEPVVAFVVGVVIFREGFGLFKLLGIALILSATVICSKE